MDPVSDFSAFGDLAFRPAQRRDQIQFSAFPRKAREGDGAAVWRPKWISVFGRIGRQAQQRFRPDLFDINVRVITLFSVPGESDLVAIRREGWLRFPAYKTGERGNFQGR